MEISHVEKAGDVRHTQVRQFFLKVPEVTVSNHVLLLPLPIISPETFHKMVN